jgi:hypothetical protein
MYHHRPLHVALETEDAANRQTASLAGVAVILLLLVAGLFLVQTLRSNALIEDCLLSGRRNCDSFVTPPR